MDKEILRKRYIKEFYLSNKLNFILTMVVTIALAFSMLVVSIIVQQVIDVITKGDINNLADVTWLTVIVILAISLLFLINTVVYPRFIYKATRQYKKYAFDKIIDKDISSFKAEGSSVFISALTNDLQSIETNYITSIFSLVLQGILFTGAIIIMFIYNPILTLVSIVLSLIPLVFSLTYGKKLTKFEKNVSDKNSSFVHFLKDSLNGFTTIKSFKAEEKIKELYNKNNSIVEDAKEQKKRSEEILSMVGEIASIIAQFGVFLFGAYLSMNGYGITAGVVVVFVQLMNFVVNPIAVVPKLLASRKASIPLIEKLAVSSYKTKDELLKVNDASLNNEIILKDVSFSYGDKEILSNLNHVFEANKSYAVIGASGSGKSTLFNLLMANESNYTGSITYDNVSLDTIKEDSICDLISLIEQNVFVFDSTIIENITMYDDFPKEEIDAVINKSGLSDLIKEKGHDYACGEGGKNLSGGERQRISIARGLLKNSKLLLMDEATSALDNETSINVSKSIANLEGATKIIITHRLEASILKMYDEILVMKNGQIFEFGTFDDLIERKDLFYSLYSIEQS